VEETMNCHGLRNKVSELENAIINDVLSLHYGARWPLNC